jgi:hypothetical protein
MRYPQRRQYAANVQRCMGILRQHVEWEHGQSNGNFRNGMSHFSFCEKASQMSNMDNSPMLLLRFIQFLNATEKGILVVCYTPFSNLTLNGNDLSDQFLQDYGHENSSVISTWLEVFTRL